MSTLGDAGPAGAQVNLGSGLQAGRDLNICQLVIPGDWRSKSIYEELDLEKLGRQIGPIPPGGDELAGAVERAHLLVIQAVELDVRAIARQVAWTLSDRLMRAPGVEPPIKLRECSGGGPIDLEALLEGAGTKVLLFTGAEPRDFASNLWMVRNRLAGHFAIVTTEHSPGEWTVAEGSEQELSFWRRPDWQSYFGRTFLEEQLAAALRLKFLPPEATGGTLAGVPPAEVVSKLRDPGRIQAFVEALPESPEEITAEGIRAKLAEAEASGDLHQASLWYRELRERDQLLALGLMLFDGLPADQVFAGIETLIEEVWRVADPMLPQFDFLDVERLGRYFQRMQPDGEGYFWIAGEQRRQMLKVAWQLHRRRLLEALPALAAMVHHAAVHLDGLDVQPDRVQGPRQAPSQSAQQQPASQGAAPAQQGAQSSPSPPGAHDRKLSWRMGRTRELYGTVRRMAGLKAATVDGLSELGGLSAAAFEGIEPCIRKLATDDSGAVRAVAAGALVDSLRKPEGRGLLLAKLNEWWSDGCQVPEWFSAGRRAELEALRATVALAAGLAAAGEPSDRMAEELVALFGRLVEDRSPRVRRALREEVLDRFITRHLRQLEEMVSTRVAAQADLLPVAALSVAKAYWWSPRETSAVLEAWRERALPAAGALPPAGAAPGNEALLSLLALSLGFLATAPDDAAFPPERIFRELRVMLAASRRPGVRWYVLVAAGRQAVRNYDLAAPLLSELLAEITLAERSILVEVFTRAYLDQRRQLEGGDETISIDGVPYPVWIRQPRPQERLTKVEQALYFWLQAWEQPVAQQVAAEGFAALAGTRLDRRERELAAQRQRAGVPQAAAAVFDPAIQPVLLRSLGPLGWLALTAVIRGRELRAALWAPFAELLWIRRQAPAGATMDGGHGAAAGAAGSQAAPGSVPPAGPRMASAEEVLKRWRLAAVNDSLRSAVDYLERALELYRWRWAAIGGSCGALWLLWSILDQMRSAPHS
jgi:hypothetical protein